jgi:hypothetical protein
MKTNIKIVSAAAILGIVGVTGIASSAFAYQGDYTKKGPNYTVERHEAMEKVFASNDYAGWVKLMEGRGRATEVVTSSNFSKFAEAHRLAESGKIAEANAIRAELGLRTGDGKAVGDGYGRKMGGRGQGMGIHRNVQ